MRTLPFRVWVGRDEKSLEPGEQFPFLVDALAHARAEARTLAVAIEIPGKSWYAFPETGSQVLGPLEPAEPDSPIEPMAAVGSDRRRAKRHSTAGLRGGSLSRLADGTPVRVRDVSVSGLQLQLPARHRLRSGQEITLTLNSKRGVIQVIGMIAWLSRSRCGIHFDWEKTPAFTKTYLTAMIADARRTRTTGSQKEPKN